jgi:mannose-6-phosphate isomerase-like protein (cupin superfamily)
MVSGIVPGRDAITTDRMRNMKTRQLPDAAEDRSPAGAEIRYLMDGPAGNLIHSTVPPGQVNRATVHATVSEFWYVLSGRGEIWRRDESTEEFTPLEPGTCIDIPVGTAFQYRCRGSEPLRFLCFDMPPWPGENEATFLDGPWAPNAPGSDTPA